MWPHGIPPLPVGLWGAGGCGPFGWMLPASSGGWSGAAAVGDENPGGMELVGALVCGHAKWSGGHFAGATILLRDLSVLSESECNDSWPRGGHPCGDCDHGAGEYCPL
ncbi:hypothetical protein KSP40_PGU021295 [Platanthera guangdongensis]|uniref:Secreted protein n=1 Tax=Platanthera guangdongensis TaxID=2320717 RepID=A0ABR2LT76_9ASPA